MNKDLVLFHLGEALEALQDMIQDINSDPDYEQAVFSIEMTHLYNHINTAWNAQDISDKERANQTEEDFYKWRRFPDNIHMD